MNNNGLKKIIFLDRDGTLCWDKGAFHSHIYDYEDLINNINVIDGAKEALKQAKQAGYLLIVVSNQAGVAKGKFKESAIHRFNDNLNKKLDNTIDGFYYCIHHDTGFEKNDKILDVNKLIKELIYDCDCRKPHPGMFYQAEEDLKNGKIQIVDESFFYNDKIYEEDRSKIKKKNINKYIVDKNNSFMIGDKLIDTVAGKNYGIKSILVRTGEGIEEEKIYNNKNDKDKIKFLDYITDDIVSAIDLILKEGV